MDLEDSMEGPFESINAGQDMVQWRLFFFCEHGNELRVSIKRYRFLSIVENLVASK
jgi:hypothetical protein